MTTNQANQKARECAEELLKKTIRHVTAPETPIADAFRQKKIDEAAAILLRHYPADEQDWKQMVVELADQLNITSTIARTNFDYEAPLFVKNKQTLAEFDAMMKGTK